MEKPHLPEEELLEFAATWNVTKVGRHREDDGTVPGWHDCSSMHPQRNNEVVICKGRHQWKVAQDNPNLFSIISWNILSDTWLTQGKSGDGSLPEGGNWPFRLQLLLHWIDQLNPDVICFQEVDYERFEVPESTNDSSSMSNNALLPKLAERGYDGRIQKPKKKAKNQPCAVATFWKTNKFQLVKEKSFSRTQCLVIESSEQENKSIFCIANVHLESSQSKEGSDRRARQLNSALAYAATEAPEAALIACGDFNTGSDSQLFQAIRQYQWHGHSLGSVYEHPSTHLTLPVSHATFMVPGHHYVIDHMLYDHELFKLKFVLDAFADEERDEHIQPNGSGESGFPLWSSFCPSDHIPIGGMFELLLATRSRNSGKERVEPTASLLSEERKTELTTQWERLQSHRPPQTKGKPTPEQIEERRNYANAIKAWKRTLEENPIESKFVTKLIKQN